MSCITGREWINCGRSGASVLTWLTDPRGLPAAQAAGKAQAYVVGLGLNDAGWRNVPLGTVTDIGSEAQTYYAGLSRIVRELNAISPKAKIFLNTGPGLNAGFNQAIRDVVEAYKSTYPIHCIDLAAHADLYRVSSLSGDAVSGHYTAIGYEQFAEIYNYLLSDYINTHLFAFQDVHHIETTQGT